MKKYRPWLLGMLILLTVTGCGSAKKEIAVLLYDETDPFIALVAENIVKSAHPGANVTLYDCKNAQTIQNEIAEDLFDKKVDLLIINPVDRLSAYIFVRRSELEGIPVIFFNREPLEEDIQSGKDIYYVGADANQSGEMQANIIDGYFGKNPITMDGKDRNGDGRVQTVILKGELGHQDAEQRTRAVVSTLEEKGYHIDLLTTVVANWQEESGYLAMEEIMGQWGPDIELLISNNDAMAIGASRYLLEKGHYKEVAGVAVDVPFPIVGIDGLPMAASAIEKGYLYGTVINDAPKMGEAISKLSGYILGFQGEMTEFDLVDDRYIWISYREQSGQ